MENLFAAFVGLIHIYIFVLESLLWGSKKANKIFQVNQSEAQVIKIFAFNQGFYNLFLAVSALLAVALSFTEYKIIASTLMVYSMTSVLAAAIVLISSNQKLYRAALIQGVPALVALLCKFIG